MSWLAKLLVAFLGQRELSLLLIFKYISPAWFVSYDYCLQSSYSEWQWFWEFVFVSCLARSCAASVCENFHCLYCDQFCFNYFWMHFAYLLKLSAQTSKSALHYWDPDWLLISFHACVYTAVCLQERRFQLGCKCWLKTGLDKVFFHMKLLSCWSQFPAGKG